MSSEYDLPVARQVGKSVYEDKITDLTAEDISRQFDKVVSWSDIEDNSVCSPPETPLHEESGNVIGGVANCIPRLPFSDRVDP